MNAETNGSASTSPTLKNTSYAQMTKNESFPTKNQAIIVDAINDTPLKDYISTIGKVINPADIRFASKISNNRVCIYVASQKIADEIIENVRTIKISNTILPIRPLISRNKRIVISNVPPIIPHTIILEALSKINIKPVSSITFLRAGINEPGYSHILSFRRQMFVNPNDIDKIPESIQINFDDTNYWLYLSGDSPVCFICKRDGHVASQCPLNNINTTNESQSIYETSTTTDKNQGQPTLPLQAQIQTPTTSTKTLDFPPLQLSPSLPTLQQSLEPEHLNTQPISNQDKCINNNPTKRQHSDTSSLTSDSVISNTPISEVSLNQTKKHIVQKKQKPNNTSLEAELLPIKLEIESNSKNYPLNFSQLYNFIEKFNKNKIPELISEFECSSASLINMINKLYIHLPNKKLKVKFRRISNLLKLAPSINSPIHETESSDNHSDDDTEIKDTTLLISN